MLMTSDSVPNRNGNASTPNRDSAARQRRQPTPGVLTRRRCFPLLPVLAVLISFSALSRGTATDFATPPAAEYVIVISVDGLGGTYLAKLFNGTATGGPYSIPNFNRLKNEGASTLAAHCDNNNYNTLPNHTSMITGRPRDNSPGFDGHDWSTNSAPDAGQTLHTNKGSYVASAFDVAHDHGLRTGMYTNKTKFYLFGGSPIVAGSYSATHGARDITGVDNGRNKIDNAYINETLGGAVVDTYIARQKSAKADHLAFLHINETDYYGHYGGWGTALWNSQAVVVDTMLGKIFKLVEQDVPAMIGNTIIILTADHGNHDNPPTAVDCYAVPVFVWGPGVPPGADLYALNAGNRQVASSYPMTTYSGMQPIRNAEVGNLALKMLGLGAIPGSSIAAAQDLVATLPSVTLGLSGSPMAEAGGTATVTATLSAPHPLQVRVSLGFAGTATLTSDYTRSRTSIAIAPGNMSGSITLTAVQDDIYENPDETIVVEIASVINGMEDGIQQVTATIADDDLNYAAWIATYFPARGDPRALPATDPDHDGMNNHEEYAFGLNPTLGTSANPIKAPLDPTSATFSYTRHDPALTGLAYTVWTSTDLRVWTQDTGARQAASAASAASAADCSGVQSVVVKVSAPAHDGKLFVRVRAE